MRITPKAVSFLAFILAVLTAGCEPARQADDPGSMEPLTYEVNLTDRSDDAFKVSLDVDNLTEENAVYQFAATAPGTYQTMDVGRYVSSFEAVSTDGSEIPVEQVSTNQWRISRPEAVSAINYSIAETWDTPVQAHPIYLMAGTSIEDDHVLINGQAVFGYPTGMQTRPLRIKLDYPAAWAVGTALRSDADGYYLADDYDQVVDSPILLGRLSEASLQVAGADVDIFTYSKTDKVQSSEIAGSVRDILDAAGQFLVQLPVDRYVLLFHYEDASAGAWEHSYSSEYVLAEPQEVQPGMPQVRSIVAHEFFHIVTPLNIHSEIIERFNFVEPVASEHVWLYEGTTEWEAQTSQLRAGLIDLDEYLNRISGKLNGDDQFDKTFSLSRLSLESYSEKGQREWGNIYQRGAVVAGLLDLLLLDKSGGTRGLREVLLDLASRYGPDRPFSEDTFFDDFAEMTYPEVRTFFDDYIRGVKPLPIAEYFGMVGIRYEAERKTGNRTASFGLGVGVSGTSITISHVGDIASRCGLEVGDTLVGFNGADVTLASANQVFSEFGALDAGVDFTIAVNRNGERHQYTCAKEMTDEVRHHVFTVEENATPEQVALREAWTHNLPRVVPAGG